MVDLFFTIRSRLNAPLFLGAFTVNRMLILALSAIILGSSIQSLIAKRRNLPAVDFFPAWAAGIAVWKIFPALQNLGAVLSDPVLVFAYTGGRVAAVAGIVAGTAVVCAMILFQRKSGGAGIVLRAAFRNVVVVLLCVVPIGILLSLPPVPGFPGR